MRDVPKWLEDLGLGKYAEAFAENKIDPDVLPSLTSDDLKDIGVRAVGDRRKLLNAITGRPLCQWRKGQRQQDSPHDGDRATEEFR